MAEMAPLERALECLAREDPTFRWRPTTDSGQLVMSGMGELHYGTSSARESSVYLVVPLHYFVHQYYIRKIYIHTHNSSNLQCL